MGASMNISKILNITFMKNLRIQNVEKIWCVFANAIFKFTYVESQTQKSLICKFTAPRVTGSKRSNLLLLNSHLDRLAIRWLAMR